jgi:hypothetical protein
MRTVLIMTAAALSLGACSTAIEAVRGPELAPIGYPAALMPTSQAYLPSPEQQQADRAASANSLWRAGARTFFGDQRARQIGDILKPECGCTALDRMRTAKNRIERLIVCSGCIRSQQQLLHAGQVVARLLEEDLMELRQVECPAAALPHLCIAHRNPPDILITSTGPCRSLQSGEPDRRA